MKRGLSISILCLLFCFNNLLFPQSQKPEKVLSIVYETKPNSWYEEQAKLWKKELDKNPKDEEAWRNYYYANRYAHFENINSEQKRKKLAGIIGEMEKAIPGTYQYYYLKYKNKHDIDDISMSTIPSYIEPRLKKLGIDADFSEIKSEAVKSSKGTPGNFISNYVNSVCALINEKKLDIPIFFALTVYTNYIKPMNDDLYIVGLAFRYSKNRLDNFTFIRNNFENKFKPNYLLKRIMNYNLNLK